MLIAYFIKFLVIITHSLYKMQYNEIHHNTIMDVKGMTDVVEEFTLPLLLHSKQSLQQHSPATNFTLHQKVTKKILNGVAQSHRIRMCTPTTLLQITTTIAVGRIPISNERYDR